MSCPSDGSLGVSMTRIALDAMGGDFAPKQIVVGAIEAACKRFAKLVKHLSISKPSIIKPSRRQNAC